jgi:hypothetical protein
MDAFWGEGGCRLCANCGSEVQICRSDAQMSEADARSRAPFPGGLRISFGKIMWKGNGNYGSYADSQFLQEIAEVAERRWSPLVAGLEPGNHRVFAGGSPRHRRPFAGGSPPYRRLFAAPLSFAVEELAFNFEVFQPENSVSFFLTQRRYESQRRRGGMLRRTMDSHRRDTEWNGRKKRRTHKEGF